MSRDYCTGCLSVPARSLTVSRSTLTSQLCYLVLVLCTSHTVPVKLALLCRSWPCAYFGSPLMTFEPSEGFSWNKFWTQRHDRQPKFADERPWAAHSVGCPECRRNRYATGLWPPSVQRSRWAFKTSKPGYFVRVFCLKRLFYKPKQMHVWQTHPCCYMFRHICAISEISYTEFKTCSNILEYLHLLYAAFSI
jgi:hypothetical protein